MSQMERMYAMDKLLRGPGMKTSDIVQRFEVTGRHVKRDIEYMRERLLAPIHFDWQTKRYHYTNDFFMPPFLDEQTLVFSALLKSLVKSSQILPTVGKKVMDVVDQGLSSEYRKLSNRIVYTIPVTDDPDYAVFSGFCEAMNARTCLSITYRNAQGSVSNRTIEALRLINYAGRWYAVAWDLLRDGLRSFHLARIQNFELTTHPVQDRHLDEELERYISAGFGIFMGVETCEALIRISGKAVYTVENQKWHKDQQITHDTDEQGEPVLLIRLPVANWAELLGRILSFGAWAEPLEPADLREQWRQKIAQMAQLAGV